MTSSNRPSSMGVRSGDDFVAQRQQDERSRFRPAAQRVDHVVADFAGHDDIAVVDAVTERFPEPDRESLALVDGPKAELRDGVKYDVIAPDALDVVVGSETNVLYRFQMRPRVANIIFR